MHFEIKKEELFNNFTKIKLWVERKDSTILEYVSNIFKDEYLKKLHIK